MNSKKIVLSTTKTTSAIFLTLLVTGTITAIFHSLFFIGVSAQVQPYYEMENNNKKSYDKGNNRDHKSKDSSRKCINTNINTNGNNTLLYISNIHLTVGLLDGKLY